LKVKIRLVWRGFRSTPMGAARKSETPQERSEATEKVPLKGGISGFFPLIPPFSYIMKKNVGGGVLHA